MLESTLSSVISKKGQMVYSIGIYLLLCPALIYGTSLGVINQSPVDLTVELLLIIFMSILLGLSETNTKGKMLSLGFILLALAMGSRLLSIWIPGVNAIAAVVMLAGIYGGSHFGFAIGGLAPYLTNMMFLQGQWTPFQMFAYGMLGFLAGLPWVAKKAKNHRLFLAGFAALMGICYSLFMDSWTMISFGTDYGWALYGLLVLQATPYTVKYLVSNVIFINILKEPVKKLVALIEVR